jgi:hypothetical protein
MKKICPGFFLDKQPKSSKGIFYNIDVFSQKITLLVNFNFREALRIHKNKCDVWSSPNQTIKKSTEIHVKHNWDKSANIKCPKAPNSQNLHFKVFAASSVKVALKCQFPQKYEHSSNHNPTVTKHHSKELHGMTSSCQEP